MCEFIVILVVHLTEVHSQFVSQHHSTLALLSQRLVDVVLLPMQLFQMEPEHIQDPFAAFQHRVLNKFMRIPLRCQELLKFNN